MKRSTVRAKESGMDGVVLGVLTKNHRVDVERTQELVEFARPLPVTYHRAFDESADLHQALEDAIETGAQRILTSGGAKTAQEGTAVLARLIEAAEKRTVIVPAAASTPPNIERAARQQGARAFHPDLHTAIL